MESRRLSEGELLGERYRILETVGRGGMGTVYRALDTRLDTDVAVKEMRQRGETEADRAAALKQFEREAKMLAQLRHPHLPKVTDYFADAGHWYLIMEFVEGKTLESVLRDGGKPLPISDVLRWGEQVAGVLTYLHEQDPPIVFRDVKPANIMLLPGGDVKLIDFGIARRYQEGAAKDTVLYGSPGYSPPEQYGRGQTNPRSDLYSLAASIHHLATGRDPAGTPFKFPRLREILPEAPPALDDLLWKCLQPDEDRRPEKAREVRDQLAHLRVVEEAAQRSGALNPGATTRAKSASIPPRTPARQPRAKWPLYTGAVLVVAALAIGLVVATRSRDKAPPPAGGNGLVTPAPSPVTPPPNTGSFQIATEPAGVQVFLGDQSIGTTPFSAPAIVPGKYLMRFVPEPESGLASAHRFVDIQANELLMLETKLSPGAPSAELAAKPSAEVVRLNAAAGSVRTALRPSQTSEGVLVTLDLRLAASKGKEATVAVFFYNRLMQPIVPVPGAHSFRNEEGRLSASVSLKPDSDPTDYPSLELFIPSNIFPENSAASYCRAFVYVGGQMTLQTDPAPIGVAGGS